MRKRAVREGILPATGCPGRAPHESRRPCNKRKRLMGKNPAVFCQAKGTLGFQTQDPVGSEAGSGRDVGRDNDAQTFT